MAKIANKAYDALLTQLENLADGIQKYAEIPKVAGGLNEAEIRALKTALEEARQSYLNKETEARMAYDTFEVKFNECRTRMSSDTRIVKGVFSPVAEALKDFGITPEKSKRSRKAKSVGAETTA